MTISAFRLFRDPGRDSIFIPRGAAGGGAEKLLVDSVGKHLLFKTGEIFRGQDGPGVGGLAQQSDGRLFAEGGEQGRG